MTRAKKEHFGVHRKSAICDCMAVTMISAICVGNERIRHGQVEIELMHEKYVRNSIEVFMANFLFLFY